MQKLEKTDAPDRKKLVKRARERLLYCLDRRLHSERELRDKLYLKYAPDIIDSAIDEIASLGLIDDLRFAIAFAEHRKDAQKKGPYKIRQELFSKGVAKDIIDEAIGEVFSDENSQIDSAVLAAEKYINQLDTEEGKRRCFAALVRKGFSYSVAKTALNQLCDCEIEQD